MQPSGQASPGFKIVVVLQAELNTVAASLQYANFIFWASLNFEHYIQENCQKLNMHVHFIVFHKVHSQFKQHTASTPINHQQSKKNKVQRWWFIKKFPKMPQKCPKKWKRQKSGGLFEFCMSGSLLAQIWQYIEADTVYHIFHKIILSYLRHQLLTTNLGKIQTIRYSFHVSNNLYETIQNQNHLTVYSIILTKDNCHAALFLYFHYYAHL